jgi:hypothetical protein
VIIFSEDVERVYRALKKIMNMEDHPPHCPR